jgi:hypothetical protein
MVALVLPAAPAGGGAARAAETVSETTSEAALPEDLGRAVADGEASFRIQDYEKVVARLAPLVPEPRLAGRPERVRILELLGASHWFLIDQEAARASFVALLRETPFHRLDTFVYPGELIAFFEAVRAELIAAGVIPANPPELPEAPPRVLVREITREHVPDVVYLAPFGVGQFVNGESGKGTTFAVVQGIGVATLAASWVAIETLKVGDTNRVSQRDAGEARLLEALWYSGAGVFIAAWGYAIVDGFMQRDRTPRIEEREERAPAMTVAPGPLGVALDVRF